LNAEDVVALADLPSKTVLLSKMVGCLQSPIRGLMNVLTGPTRNLVGILSAIREKKESQG